MTKSLEDYLEAIYLLSMQTGFTRVVDVANKLHVKMPSVNNAVKELANLELLRYERYREIVITEEGVLVAKKVFEHHTAIKKFLLSLGVSEENAEHDACAMEHILSEETMEAFKRATGSIGKRSTRRPGKGGHSALDA